MKRFVKWAAACILIVAFQLVFTLWYLVPYITDHRYTVFWESVPSGYGWKSLTLYYAWPGLVTYGGALLTLSITAAVAIGYSIHRREKEDIDQREKEVRSARAEAERIRIVAERQMQAAKEEIARHEQEAAARVEDAEFRLDRSVGVNIGRQRQIQNLKARVKELEERVKELVEQVTIGHC